jgi:hypothetical protein
MKYPTCAQSPLLSSDSLTQKDRHPLKYWFATWIFAWTPVFGRADPSTDWAPTHQTPEELACAWVVGNKETEKRISRATESSTVIRGPPLCVDAVLVMIRNRLTRIIETDLN